MGAEQLRDLLRARPFVPIRLQLTDGTTYEILHPEMAFLTRTTVEIGREGAPGSGIAESVIYCSFVHIVRAEQFDRKALSAH